MVDDAGRLGRPLSHRLGRGPAGRGRRGRVSSHSPSAVGARVQMVGDDLLVTDAGADRDAGAGAATAVLLKPNQRGTLTETLRGLGRGASGGLAGIVSARSGETEDTTIVHLAVGWGVGQLKVGSIRARRADREMERGAAHRGGDGAARPFRRGGNSGTLALTAGTGPGRSKKRGIYPCRAAP